MGSTTTRTAARLACVLNSVWNDRRQNNHGEPNRFTLERRCMKALFKSAGHLLVTCPFSPGKMGGYASIKDYNRYMWVRGVSTVSLFGEEGKRVTGQYQHTF